MPKIIRDTIKKLELLCDDESDSFVIQYTNMGEPYREGIEIGVKNNDLDKEVIVMLKDNEAKKVRDLLIKLYPMAG